MINFPAVNMAEVPPQQRPQPRNYRQRRDVFNDLSDAELIRRYRLDREGILFVTNLVRAALESDTMRNNPLTPELKVIITLRYLATGKMQLCSSDDLGPSQPSISKAISQTIDALCDINIMRRFIRFPTTQDVIEQNKADFFNISRFPHVIGAVDGTYVRIKAPKENEEVFVNRKGYHSINVQVVFDAKCKLLGILAKWPGSVHDSRILNDSGVTTLFERGYTPAGCHLFGDHGYGGKTWLLTPYLRPRPGHQSRYNININIPVDEEYDVVGEAEDDVARRAVVRAPRAVPLPQAVRRNAARLYRDDFSYLHFSCFLSASMEAHAGAEMVGVDMDATSMDASQTYNTSVPSSKLLSAGVDGSVLWPAGDDASSNGSWLCSEIID
ncbi:putative nuclease HARBI1 [Chionoecetes opilio]|uniref:Putative nuclease HARBI1 n=1 Tax=Chionoecetes opilio TaxID=41210 RepID=A0A8J5CRH2_CHIOP|nr:putative nuclease HARBI1 [Chionoecetes opilio]